MPERVMNKRSFETGIYTSNAVKKFIKFCATNRIAHDEIEHLLRAYSLPSAHTGGVNHETKTKPAPRDIL
jgi:hypothetical protein